MQCGCSVRPHARTCAVAKRKLLLKDPCRNFRQTPSSNHPEASPQRGAAPPGRLKSAKRFARLTYSGQVETGHKRLSKSHYEKWLSNGVESRFFSQHLCVALAICRSNPATGPHRFHSADLNPKASAITSPMQTKKPTSSILNGLQFSLQGARKMPKRASLL